MVERSLRMREARGSIPRTSTIFILSIFSEVYVIKLLFYYYLHKLRFFFLLVLLFLKRKPN